ncbi:MAG: DUF1631 family protein [Proteobacteria bacterium]|nr:DUF1631 family protein [Pseudomonadota bacterium]
MIPASESRPPAAIDAALHAIQTTLSAVAGRVSDALGASAQSTTRIHERDLLNSSQFELRRNMGTFQIVFRDTLREKVQQEIAPRAPARRSLANADWQTLSLVDDHEVEERMYADRIGQTIAHECEAELRELGAYMGALLQTGRAEPDRNPLRAEIIGAALYRSIEAVSEDAEARKLLSRDLGQAMARAMSACYAQILADLQARGVQPLGLTVRGVEGPGNLLPGFNSGYGTLSSTRSHSSDFGSESLAGAEPGTGLGAGYAPAAQGPGPGHPASGYGPRSTQRAGLGSGWQQTGARATSAADAQLMVLLRRLTAIASRPGELDALPGTHDSGPSTSQRGDFRRSGGSLSGPPSGAGYGTGYDAGYGAGLMAPNLIRAHRDELMRASTGQLDHMVIDVVGSLFDQILSDSRVPPQMARQIARLQLPVLRVALHDPTFFSSRRHPVRRFVNRIASLACAFDDFDDGPGKELLTRVRSLVQDIVEGDFDQIELYAAKLAELEVFIAEQTQGGAVRQSNAVATLDGKESELRIQQRYLMQLQAALAPISLPPYLRDFLAQVWSQALVVAVRREGPAAERTQRYRRVGRDLVMSVQPKGSPILRKKFLMQLPALMKDLNEGLQQIGWPEAAQRAFFAQLLPAHAESLKGTPMSELDYNMMAKQLEAIFAVPVPGTESLSPADPPPEIDEAVIEQRFSKEEAARVGFVPEAAVDWAGPVSVDIDLGAAATDEPAATSNGAFQDTAAGAETLDLGIDIHLDAGEPSSDEPSRGPQLIDHIKLGFAYQMHLKDEWQKVRLAHVSAGRTFFVFTHGKKHQETISMTSRMLSRMCETGRLRAVESAYLMERATQRARRQLAALRGNTRH